MKVKSVTYAGKADVFNMEVEDTHNFVIQGGVISHNCADAWRYFLMSRPIAPRIAQKPDGYNANPLNFVFDIKKEDLQPYKAKEKIQIIRED